MGLCRGGPCGSCNCSVDVCTTVCHFCGIGPVFITELTWRRLGISVQLIEAGDRGRVAGTLDGGGRRRLSSQGRYEGPSNGDYGERGRA